MSPDDQGRPLAPWREQSACVGSEPETKDWNPSHQGAGLGEDTPEILYMSCVYIYIHVYIMCKYICIYDMYIYIYMGTIPPVWIPDIAMDKSEYHPWSHTSTATVRWHEIPKVATLFDRDNSNDYAFVYLSTVFTNKKRCGDASKNDPRCGSMSTKHIPVAPYRHPSHPLATTFCTWRLFCMSSSHLTWDAWSFHAMQIQT